MTDPNVLAAQQWVNATYAGVDGYLDCAEDGRTGWGTVLSLTQALQHELGISPVVQNFGPGTFGKVESRNTRPDAETNKNIIRIYNYALWCKGYYGSARPDTWDSTAQNSLSELWRDMGLPSDITIRATMWARVSKALLRMDQFRLVPGGEIRVQYIQRRLNSRYVLGLGIPAMGLVPCDGVYSRDVQQGLMMAIQYEIGIAPAEITGYFGEGTKAGLKSHPVTPTDLNSPLGFLFRAACLFNSPTYDDDFGEYPYSLSFSAAEHSAWLVSFKNFSRLFPLTDTGDYRTWAQLLVSTGDPNRYASGCDGITEITPQRGKALRDAQYRLVGRYLDERLEEGDDGWLDKAIKPGELQTIFDAGLRVFPISQYYGRTASAFTFGQGAMDAWEAQEKARSFGFNRGTCIYFAVDFDAIGTEINQYVIPYFKGVRFTLAQHGNYYQFGVYGSRNVCEQVSRNTGARWSFVSGMSWGFSGNLGYPLPRNWSLNQIRNYDFDGDGVRDLDADVWRESTDPGADSVNRPARHLDQLVSVIKQLEEAADSYESAGGFSTHQLITQFFRYGLYDGAVWDALLHPIEQAWISHAKAQDISVDRTIQEVTDPISLAAIGTQHLMASVEGFLRRSVTTDSSNLADMAGWGGDLVSFYIEWRKNRDAYPSGLAFCQDRLGRPGVNSTFGYSDFIEDADAFNLSLRLRAGQHMSQAVSEYYNAQVAEDGISAGERWRSFYANRFGRDYVNVERLAEGVLGGELWQSGVDIIFMEQEGLDTDQYPTSIPASDLDSFLLGFRWALTNRVNAEGGAS